MPYDAGNYVGNLMQVINPVTSAREVRYFREYIAYVFNELKRGNPQYEKGYQGLIAKIKENNKKGNSVYNPILLIPGFWEDKSIYWDSILQYLRSEQTLHAYYLYLYSFRSIEENADKLVEIAEITLELTGAKKIDLIGHSMGGLVVMLAALKKPDLFEKTVAIGSPFHGTLLATRVLEVLDRLPGIIKRKIQNDMGYDFVAIRELQFKSDFTSSMRERIEQRPDFAVRAFSIFSENDEAVIPWYSAVFEGIHNININRHLGKKFIGHIDLVYNVATMEIIESILDDTIDPTVYTHVTFDECLAEARKRSNFRALARGLTRLPLFNGYGV